MTIGIYCISFNNGDLVYIGKSENIETRISSHINNLERGAHTNYKVQRAWDQYNDSFYWYIVEVCTIDSLNDSEQVWIKEYNAIEAGLNLPYRNNHKKGFAARGQPEPTLISPEGIHYHLTSLADFCKEFPKLDMGALHKLIFNPERHKSHLGWRLFTPS